MWNEGEPPGLIAQLGPAALGAIGVLVLCLLPIEALKFLIVWTLASFPIGVLIGHCVLSEE